MTEVDRAFPVGSVVQHVRNPTLRAVVLGRKKRTKYAMAIGISASGFAHIWQITTNSWKLLDEKEES